MCCPADLSLRVVHQEEKEKLEIFSVHAKWLILWPTLVWLVGRLKSEEMRCAGNYPLSLFYKLAPELCVQETTPATQAWHLLATWPHTLARYQLRISPFLCQFYIYNVERVRFSRLNVFLHFLKTKYWHNEVRSLKNKLKKGKAKLLFDSCSCLCKRS